MNTNKWQKIVFTKHFLGLNIDQLIEVMKYIGVDGVDLCVRPGYPVEPENVRKTLPEAAKKFNDAGLIIGLITTPVDFIDPKKPEVEILFDACRISNVKLIKLGYWYMNKEGYWKTVEKVRKEIEQFIKLAEKYQVKILIHNHSGSTMGLNSSSVMNLIKGFDPKYVGVFADTGHLSLVGEPLPMALNIVKEYLSAVAVKDIIRERIIIEGKRKWQMRVVPLGEGFVDWETLINLLLDMNYKGPISFHSEYGGYEIEDLIDQTKMDMRFFKRIFNECIKRRKNG